MHWLQCLVNKILRLSQWHLCLCVTFFHTFSTLLSPSCHDLCVCDYRNLKDANVLLASSIYSGRSLPLFPFCTPPRSSRSPCFRTLLSRFCLGLGDQFEFKIWDVFQVWDFLICDTCQLCLLPDQTKILFQNPSHLSQSTSTSFIYCRYFSSTSSLSHLPRTFLSEPKDVIRNSEALSIFKYCIWR